MSNVVQTADDKLFTSRLTKREGIEEVYYRIPCTPTKDEIEVYPEMQKLLSDEVCIDFITKKRSFPNFVAYHKYDIKDANFDLIYRYLDNRGIELQLIQENQIIEELDLRKVPYLQYHDWANKIKNEKFINKHVYDFGQAVESSEKTLHDEIELFANGDDDFQEKLIEMCKFLIFEGYLILLGSDPTNFKEKFDSTIHEHDLFYGVDFSKI